MTETPETPNEKSQSPICPYCNGPFVPDAIPYNVPNGVQLLVLFCEECRKVVSTVILAMPQQRVQPQSPIITPGRPQ
jgi:hypothetical protein